LKLPGGFLGIISLIRKPTGSPKKLSVSPKEAIKTFRAEILTIFSLVFGQNDHTKKTFRN
jgi:hypothetical protein